MSIPQEDCDAHSQKACIITPVFWICSRVPEKLKFSEFPGQEIDQSPSLKKAFPPVDKTARVLKLRSLHDWGQYLDFVTRLLRTFKIGIVRSSYCSISFFCGCRCSAFLYCRSPSSLPPCLRVTNPAAFIFTSTASNLHTHLSLFDLLSHSTLTVEQLSSHIEHLPDI